MRPLMLLLALWPGLAAAGPDQSWGRALDGTPAGSEIHLRTCDGGCAAEVVFVNRHLWGPALTRRFVLDRDGLSVAVTIVDGELTAPDQLVVEPPPGYRATPPSIEVGEEKTGVIRLDPIPMS